MKKSISYDELTGATTDVLKQWIIERLNDYTNSNDPSNVELYGYKLSWRNRPALIDKQGKLIRPKSSSYFPDDKFYEEISDSLPREQRSMFPLELHLRDYRGMDYVAESALFAEWDGDRV